MGRKRKLFSYSALLNLFPFTRKAYRTLGIITKPLRISGVRVSSKGKISFTYRHIKNVGKFGKKKKQKRIVSL